MDWCFHNVSLMAMADGMAGAVAVLPVAVGLRAAYVPVSVTQIALALIAASAVAIAGKTKPAIHIRVPITPMVIGADGLVAAHHAAAVLKADLAPAPVILMGHPLIVVIVVVPAGRTRPAIRMPAHHQGYGQPQASAHSLDKVLKTVLQAPALSGLITCCSTANPSVVAL